MMNGKINPVSGIFLGKNNFGYKDQQEYVLTPNQKQVAPEDVKIIESKYEELPGEYLRTTITTISLTTMWG
jgi:hypothetical protein